MSLAAGEHRLHDGKARQFFLRRKIRAVGDIVGIAGELVESMHMWAQGRADQDGAYRKILLRASLARPGLHVRGRVDHPLYLRCFHMTPLPRIWSAADPTVAAV